MNTPERRQWRRSTVFIVNFENISHVFLVFLLLTLFMYLFAEKFSVRLPIKWPNQQYMIFNTLVPDVH